MSFKVKATPMKKVSIEPGCITCGLCEFIAPDVFEVTDISRVKIDAPIDAQRDAIKEAAVRCPVQVISYEEIIDHATQE
jgi:ferredoxin